MMHYKTNLYLYYSYFDSLSYYPVKCFVKWRQNTSTTVRRSLFDQRNLLDFFYCKFLTHHHTYADYVNIYQAAKCLWLHNYIYWEYPLPIRIQNRFRKYEVKIELRTKTLSESLATFSSSATKSNGPLSSAVDEISRFYNTSFLIIL